ncbi:hypothetical protein ABBQ32_006326 [Trebouxia sp. C0010 RCD-2024]
MSAMLLSAQTCVKPVVGRAPALHRARAFRSCRPQYNRNVVMMAERPRQDDNPADKAAAQLEDKLEGFVEATKENSGLFKDTISQQPGNKDAKKGSIIDESGEAGEAMSPGGLVPEITNGRGAMAAMLIAFVKELTTGKPVGEQIKSDPIFIVIVFGLIIVGSIVPVFRGADLNQKGAGPFTPRAEIWNGRVAMVAFALLLIVEGFKGGPGLIPGGGAPTGL